MYYVFMYLFVSILYVYLGIGDWGLGIGDWAQSPITNRQSPNQTKYYATEL